MNREILRLAIPSILSSISVPLLSSADYMLMGRMDSPVHMGAIFVGSTIFNAIYWAFAFLRMGTTGMTAQAFGAKDSKEIARCFWQAAAVALCAGLVLILLSKAIEVLAIYLMDPAAEVIDPTLAYFRIRILAAPAALLLYVFNGWFFGMQNARYPLYLTLVVNLLNIGLNFFFVLGLGMKSEGVAYATLAAQYCGLLGGLALIFFNYQDEIKHFAFQELGKLKAYTRFFNVNSDIFVRSVMLNLTFVYFAAKSSQVDPVLLAANGILLQLIFLFSYAVDGFAYAAESLTGRFIGARDRLSLSSLIRYLFRWGAAFSILYILTFALFTNFILGLYTTDLAVVDRALQFFPWVLLLTVPSVVAFLWDGIYIGATASGAMRNNMLMATLLFFFPVFFLLKSSLGNHALWAALMAFMTVRALGLTVLAKRYIYTPLSFD